MEIIFDKGSEERPKGHALLYFRSASNTEELWASYLVILPIEVDLSKYVPPFLMSQVGDLGPKELSAFAFPPAPEKTEGYKRLEELAALRDDDILFGGTIDPTDVPAAMMSVNEGVQRYAEIYSQQATVHVLKESTVDEDAAGLSVNEVLYGMMSDRDKLKELTRLVGRLRFAMEGGEEGLANEAEVEVNLLARHLPKNHKIPRLIEAAKAVKGYGARLADLYLQRCFHLIQEEYVKLGEVEEEIKALEAGESSS